MADAYITYFLKLRPPGGDENFPPGGDENFCPPGGGAKPPYTPRKIEIFGPKNKGKNALKWLILENFLNKTALFVQNSPR